MMLQSEEKKIKISIKHEDPRNQNQCVTDSYTIEAPFFTNEVRIKCINGAAHVLLQRAIGILCVAPRDQDRNQQDSTVVSKEPYLEMNKYLLIYFLIGWENFMKTIFRRIKKFKKSVCHK